MTPTKPRVSIGLPIYNAERYLRGALDGILSQTYHDFELIICDNASTDSTPQICHEYAAKDPRIRYYRNHVNLGVSRNFNRAFELSTGEYFKWCAHDDLLAADYVEKCVKVLDENPDVVLCYSKARSINEHGEEVRYYTYTLRTDSPRASERFHDLALYEHPCFQNFALIRAAALRQTPLHEHYAWSDRVFLARLGLLGRFYRIPEYLHTDRDHAETSVKRFKNLHNVTRKYFNPQWPDDKLIFPAWMQLGGYLRAIMAYRMPLAERLACLRVMLVWVKRYRPKLVRDVRWALKKPLKPVYTRLRPRQG